MSTTVYDMIDEIVKEGDTDDITHMIIDATNSILSDPVKIEYMIKQCAPIRKNFKGWDRIVGIVQRYFVEIGHDHAYRMQFYYINPPDQPK